MLYLCKHCGTEDLSADIRENGPHNTAYCLHCGGYIKHVDKPITDFKIWFGKKYKGQSVTELSKTKEGMNYLRWLYDNKDQYSNLKTKHLVVIAKLVNA